MEKFHYLCLFFISKVNANRSGYINKQGKENSFCFILLKKRFFYKRNLLSLGKFSWIDYLFSCSVLLEFQVKKMMSTCNVFPRNWTANIVLENWPQLLSPLCSNHLTVVLTTTVTNSKAQIWVILRVRITEGNLIYYQRAQMYHFLSFSIWPVQNPLLGFNCHLVGKTFTILTVSSCWLHHQLQLPGKIIFSQH